MAAYEPEHPGIEDRNDLATWRSIVAEGQLSRRQPGEIVCACRKAKSLKDEQLESDLACHLSDVVIRELKRKVKSSFPDGGREIVDDAHFKIMEAVFDPASADGKALPEHFEARLHFRFLDALKRQRQRQQVELPPLIDNDGSQEDSKDALATFGFDSVEVAHTLALIRDERKRLAFIMTMTNQKKGEIAKALEIDPTTLLRWIKEVRTFLKTELNL